MSPRAPARDRGAVTVELALALPAVVLVLAVMLATVGLGAAQLRLVDSARAGARVAALALPDSEVVATAREVAGAGAEVTVERAPPWVRVTVRDLGPGGPVTGGAPLLSATATAWLEP